MSYEKPNGYTGREKEFTDRPVISAASSTLLEAFAQQNHIFIGIFDSIRSHYIFQTTAATHSALDNINIAHPLDFIHNKEIQHDIMDMETKLTRQFNSDEKKNSKLFICGGYPSKAGQNGLKYFLQRVPLAFGSNVYEGIYLDSIQNVTHLVSGEGYWLRLKAKEKVYSWFSIQKKLLHHDLISVREKEVIRYWANGYSLSRIEDTLFISVNTIKNHLKACRNRLLTRDNASLVHICLLSDVFRDHAIF